MRLTLSEVLRNTDNHGAVYVLNKTRGDTRGPVIFACPKLRGAGTDVVRVPDTFLPINLIEQVPKDQLFQSTDFRRAVASEMLHLVDDAEATEILSKPGVGEELERLRAQRDQLAGYASNMLGEGAKTVRTDDNVIGADLNKRMQSLLARIGDSGEVAVINSLRAISDDLSTADLEHLTAFANQRGFKKLKKFADNLLA